MKYLLALTLLFVSVPYSMAFPSLDGNQEPAIAFACKDCDFLAAEHIAIQEAPENTCSIYRNGPNAAYCESVSQEILIPVHDTRNTFKFTVTTSINSQNIPVVSVTSFFPLTATQNSLMNQFFDLYDDFSQAVDHANMSSDELSPAPIFTTNENPMNIGAKDDACESHPISYFSDANSKRSARRGLASRIQESIGGSTAAEYQNEVLVSGGSLQFSAGADGFGVGIGVNVQYIEKNLIVFKGDDFENRLAFDLRLATDSANKVRFSLSLNKEWTKIDGFKYWEVFGSSGLDLASGHGLVSNCLLDFFSENTEPLDSEPTTGAGDGSFQNPFEGLGISSATNSLDFCLFTRKFKNCSTTKEGETCTKSTVSWIGRCSSVSNP